MGNNRFTRQERLRKKKVIDDVFAKGASKSIFPLKLIFLPHPEATQKSHQVLVTIPTRNFPKAVDRNTIKRRIREGYRLNKSLATVSSPYCLAYIYIAKEILPSATIHQAVRSSLEVLNSYEKKD